MDKSIKPTPHNRSILPVLRIELRFLGLPTRGVASSSDSLELQSCSACMLDPSSDAASVAVCYCKVQQQVWNGNKENSVGRACRATSIRFMRNCPHYSLASRGRGGGLGSERRIRGYMFAIIMTLINGVDFWRWLAVSFKNDIHTHWLWETFCEVDNGFVICVAHEECQLISMFSHTCMINRF